MQKLTAALLLACLSVSISCVPASAEDACPISRLHQFRSDPATTRFLSAFIAYAQAVKDQGSQGVKKITTSSFALRQGNQSVQGEKAFQELGTCMDDFSKEGYTASVRPLSISGTEVVALTRETFEMQLGSARGAVIYYGKQTWRMTPQGWKLAVIEIQGAENIDTTAGLGFTVTPKAQEKPAKAQEKPAKAQEKPTMVK